MGKEKRFSEELLCAALLVGVAFGVVAGAAIYASAYPIFQSEHWAAWVQALGVIAALIGSLWVSRVQTRTAFASITEAQSLAARAKMGAIFAIVEAAYERSEKIAETFRRENPRFSLYDVYAPSVTSSVIGALTSAPAHEAGSRKAVLALLDIRDQFVYLDQAIAVFMDGPRKHPDLSKIFESYGPGDPDAVKLCAQYEALLARNVLVHTAAITKQYKSFESAIKQHLEPDASIK